MSQKIDENANFIKWRDGNKIKDLNDNPIVAFHGSVNESFSEIDLDKSNDYWWVGKGFYTSSSIKDVNENYATNTIEEDGRFQSKDLGHRISEVTERICEAFDSDFTEDFLGEDLSEFEGEEFIPFAVLSELKDGKWKDVAESLVNDNEEVNFSDFVTEIAHKEFINNSGWVHPVFVKMVNPAHYTTDSTATLIKPINDEINQFKYDNDSLFDNFQRFIALVSEHLTFLNNGVTPDGFSEGELSQEIYDSYGVYYEIESSSIYIS